MLLTTYLTVKFQVDIINKDGSGTGTGLSLSRRLGRLDSERFRDFITPMALNRYRYRNRNNQNRFLNRRRGAPDFRMELKSFRARPLIKNECEGWLILLNCEGAAATPKNILRAHGPSR